MKTIIPLRRYRFRPKDFTLRDRTHSKTITLAPCVSCTEVNRFFRITRVNILCRPDEIVTANRMLVHKLAGRAQIKRDVTEAYRMLAAC